MTTTQIIAALAVGAISTISYLIGAGVERAKSSRRRYNKAMIQPIVKYNLQPIELKFEREFDPEEARLRGLSPQEQAWQERRQLASDACDYLHGALMHEGCVLVDRFITPADDVRHPREKYRITYIIRVLPKMHV